MDLLLVPVKLHQSIDAQLKLDDRSLSEQSSLDLGRRGNLAFLLKERKKMGVLVPKVWLEVHAHQMHVHVVTDAL